MYRVEVPLVKNLTIPEDPTQIKFPGSGTCTLHPSVTASLKARIRPKRKSNHRVSLACVDWFDLQHLPIDFRMGARCGTWHVVGGTGHSAIGTIVFPSFLGVVNGASPVQVGPAVRALV